ncbi:MAG: ADOP family duplicated permease, partial [Acidobacteriaceae bacterium]
MNWLRWLFQRRRMTDDLSEEMRQHLDEKIEALVANGMPREEAVHAARRAFGNATLLEQRSREIWMWPLVESIWADIKFALRQLRKSPGFAITAILTLALGIGATAAMFSVVDAVLLRPLPYADAGRLVFLPDTAQHGAIVGPGVSYPVFTELRDHNHVFDAMASLAGHALTMTAGGEPADVSTIAVTQDFFSLFGVKPLVGRTLLPQDGTHGVAPVAVLSEDLWRSRFGGDPGIVGTLIKLDNRPYLVVGIMPAAFRTPFFNQPNQIWMPLAQDPLFSTWVTKPPFKHWMPVIARLRPGVSFAHARAEMETISSRLAKQFPAENGWQIGLQPLHKAISGDLKLPLFALLGAVAFVLLIACANIANLLLTRATTRQKEMAIRFALGADRRRIARQLFTECIMLGVAGGSAGTFAAWLGISGLASLLPSELPRFHPVQMNTSVLGLAIALSLASAMLFGLSPMLIAIRSASQVQLRETAGAGLGRNSRRTRDVLVVMEVAVAVVLVVSAGLLMRSFARLTSVDPGFDANHVVKAELSLPRYAYSTPQQWAAFADRLMKRLQAQPGLKDSAIAAPLPILDTSIDLPFSISGNPALPPGRTITADYITASPDYFRVMKIPLLRGRIFDKSDVPSSPSVVLISQVFAKRYFPNQNPIGRQLVFGFSPSGKIAHEIVGIVGNVRDESLSKQPGPMMYVPFAQAPLWGGEVVVRT